MKLKNSFPNIELEKKLFKEYKNVVGIDEVGRGCLAGPLVMSGFLMQEKDIEKYSNTALLQQVKDSKLLSKVKRERISPILKSFPNFLSSCSNKYIDDNGISSGINHCVTDIVTKVLGKKPSKETIFLIDGNYKFQIDAIIKSIIDGDALHFSISSASIIAKVYRDKLMQEFAKEYPEYDLENNVGYGTKKHILAIKKFGITSIHRKSFIHL